MTISAAAACLLMVVYFEGRSEPIMGQYAIAEVVMNRVADTRFPDTVCGVVKQRRWVKKYNDDGELVSARWVCQFSFWCDGKPERYNNHSAYRQALAVAVKVINKPTNFTEGALFYHTDYVRPSWRKKMTATIMIGRAGRVNHIFYTDKEGN